MIKIGPIQPKCSIGGVLLSDLINARDVKGTERVLLKVVDPLGNSRQYAVDDIDASMALHYTINASATGPGRVVPSGP